MALSRGFVLIKQINLKKLNLSFITNFFYQEEKPCANNKKCYGVCDGTLLNSCYVLTAAHCINNKTNHGAITVVAGLHNKELVSESVRSGWNSDKLENGQPHHVLKQTP
ncbi:unnamed protein product [Rotaria socialis]